MRRSIVDVVAVALLAGAAVIALRGGLGDPTVPQAGLSPLKYILLATVFIPFLVRAWAGRDSYIERGSDAFILLGVDVTLVAGAVWLVATLPRAVLLVTVVIAIQGAFTHLAWRRARRLRPR